MTLCRVRAVSALACLLPLLAGTAEAAAGVQGLLRVLAGDARLWPVWAVLIAMLTVACFVYCGCGDGGSPQHADGAVAQRPDGQQQSDGSSCTGQAGPLPPPAVYATPAAYGYAQATPPHVPPHAHYCQHCGQAAVAAAAPCELPPPPSYNEAVAHK